MILIVDTNIIVSGLLKKGITRRLLIHPDLKLFTPEFTLIEIVNIKKEFHNKSELGREEFSILLEGIISHIAVVPIIDFKKKWLDAYNIMAPIDVYDTPFVALALAFDNDGIWTNDKDFEKQDIVKIWKTKDLVKILI